MKKIDENLERWIMFLLLAGITLVLGIQIVFRFILNNSLTWSEELARFMFIWSTFLSIGFCLREGISLKIDTLISLFPKKVQAIILLLSRYHHDGLLPLSSSQRMGIRLHLGEERADQRRPAGSPCILSRVP